jgi:hypothetical protein
MPKKKEKHPSEMSNDELAVHVFHPKVLAHAKEHIERLNAEAAKTKRKPKKGAI